MRLWRKLVKLSIASNMTTQQLQAGIVSIDFLRSSTIEMHAFWRGSGKCKLVQISIYRCWVMLIHVAERQCSHALLDCTTWQRQTVDAVGDEVFRTYGLDPCERIFSWSFHECSRQRLTCWLYAGNEEYARNKEENMWLKRDWNIETLCSRRSSICKRAHMRGKEVTSQLHLFPA